MRALARAVPPTVRKCLSVSMTALVAPGDPVVVEGRRRAVPKAQPVAAAAHVCPVSNRVENLLAVCRPEITECDFSVRLQVRLPHIPVPVECADAFVRLHKR